MNFSLAPWKVVTFEGNYYVENEKVTSVCRVRIRHKEEETEANARLIAAAPEMYELLKLLIDQPEDSGLRRQVFDQAEKLLAKIEGKDGKHE